jgi:hypothetical protein
MKMSLWEAGGRPAQAGPDGGRVRPPAVLLGVAAALITGAGVVAMAESATPPDRIEIAQPIDDAEPEPTASPVARVIVVRPQPDATTNPPAARAHVATFDAHQRYGSSAADPPFDVFWGTATSGTLVGAWSPYGSAKTRAGPDGRWQLRVTFALAPAGRAFEVKVKTPGGDLRAFAFTRLAS